MAGRTGVVTLSTSDVSEGSALYYTDARARAALSGTAPITVSSATGAIGITQASGSAHGYLSSTDWTSFNAKQPALGYTPLNKAGDAMTGNLAMGSNKITGLADPTATADATSKSYVDTNLGGAAFDQAARTDDYVIKWDAGSGKYYLAADQTGAAGGGITSINGLIASGQTLVVSASGTAPAFSSSTSTHTLNIPLAATAGVTAGLISKAEFDTFSGKQAAIGSSTTVNAGAITTVLQNGVELKPFDTGAGQTGELRFDELAANGTHYVGFKAPDSLAGNVVWTLPGGDGTTGQLLQSDGTGGLSWVSGSAPTGAAGGDLTGNFPNPTLASSGVAAGTYPKVTVDAKGRVTNGSSTVNASDIEDGTIANADISGTAQVATSKLSGAVTSISGHGLGSLATLNTIGSSEITDGQIADADVSSTAAIATSKLSGAVTQVAGHGLGALATASSVTTTEITDGTIANADISGTAAIATSKLSGTVTSIAGHGLGSLATLSTVGASQITDGSITDADISGTAAISSTKVIFAADSISGDKIDGGTISNFASTGIDDNASALAMTINSSGNVGIGTTAPAGLLDANGKLTVLSGGNVGVGTTTPSARLEVAGTAGVDGIRFPDGTLQTSAAGGGTIFDIQTNRPAASQAGRLFMPSNGTTIDRDNGSTWDAFGPIFRLTPPVDASFSWVNQGTASVTATDRGIYLYAPDVAGDQLRLRVKAAPATPYSIIVGFIPQLHSVNYNGGGIGFRESSTGKLVTLGLSEGPDLGIANWVSPTNWGTTPLKVGIITGTPLIWYKISNDGTNLSFAWSADGENFMTERTTTKNSHFTTGPDQVFFFANSNNGAYAAAITVVSWKETSP